MNKETAGPWVRRFLAEYVLGERNYSRHTQQVFQSALLQPCFRHSHRSSGVLVAPNSLLLCVWLGGSLAPPNPTLDATLLPRGQVV